MGWQLEAMKTHDEMVREWRQDPAFVREYDGLAQEFALFDELLPRPQGSRTNPS